MLVLLSVRIAAEDLRFLPPGHEILREGGASLGQAEPERMVAEHFGITVYDGVSQQRPHNDRHSDCERQQPVGERREVLPHRQLPSVIYVEGYQQQNV